MAALSFCCAFGLWPPVGVVAPFFLFVLSNMGVHKLLDCLHNAEIVAVVVLCGSCQRYKHNAVAKQTNGAFTLIQEVSSFPQQLTTITTGSYSIVRLPQFAALTNFTPLQPLNQDPSASP